MGLLSVPADAPPTRLDVFLARHVPGCSRRRAQRAIAARAIRINGRLARKGDRVQRGDCVQVADELFAPEDFAPNARLVIPILYEDDWLVALDKPAGMPSHPLRSQETETAANFLLARHPEMAAAGTARREAGLVHRLDVDTSGVLLAARTAAAYAALRQQFSAHRVRKQYLALVYGEVVTSGIIRTPIAHDPRNRRKTRAVSGADADVGREAVTAYRPLRQQRAATLLEVEIRTGVMHQIRVHLASIGHPVVGDRLYAQAGSEIKESRHLLHAWRLSFAHPTTAQPLTITSPPPADWGGEEVEDR